MKMVVCKKCGSTDVRKKGWNIFATEPRRRQQYQCKNCGHVYSMKLVDISKG